MDFVKEFATFLHEKKALKFGDFTLSSGKKSPYYIDLRLVSSYPHIFRKMIKNLQNSIEKEIGYDNFDCVGTVPTGGLIIASSLSYEILKPLVYVRNQPKDYGTSKSIEGHTFSGQKILMVDDVVTTGTSVLRGIEELRKVGTIISDAWIIVDRMEGAKKTFEEKKVNLHKITDILKITRILNEQGLVSDQILTSVENRVITI